MSSSLSSKIRLPQKDYRFRAKAKISNLIKSKHPDTFISGCRMGVLETEMTRQRLTSRSLWAHANL